MNSAKLKSMISKKTINNNSLNLFQMFYFERLLDRISKSKYKGQIILKGGLLLSSIIGEDERTTKDLDATLKGMPLTKNTIEKIFGDILNVELEDNVSFEIISIKDIRLEDEYGGFKLNILAQLDNNKTFITVELTTGDVITPREIVYGYQCMFEDKIIPIMAYTIETILAEKFHTIITRGVLNTRMKDFYDMYILMNLKRELIDIKTLCIAIEKTFERRKTSFEITEFYGVLNNLKQNEELGKLWTAYQLKNDYAKNVDFNNALIAVEHIIKILKQELVVM